MREDRDAELAREIRSHLELDAEERMANGAPVDEADWAAHRAFGNVSRVREETRALWTRRWVEQVAQELRYTLRGLLRSLGFAMVAVLTLALGIGGATTMFAMVDPVLLKPLPYGNADRLVEISEFHSERGEMAVRAADFASWRHDVHALDRTTAFFWYDATFTDGDRPEAVVGEHVLDDFFGVLGAYPALGRTFTAADYGADASNTVVLSDRLWRRRFGADPSIIGRSISVDQTP
jgi:hypothetical protein